MTNTTTNEIARPRRKGLNSTVWVLQGMTGLAFLAAGAAKLMGSPIMVSEFQAIGVGQWFRYLTGIMERCC